MAVGSYQLSATGARMNQCEVCGGAGRVEIADVYRDVSTGESVVDWAVGETVLCACIWALLEVAR